MSPQELYHKFCVTFPEFIDSVQKFQTVRGQSGIIKLYLIDGSRMLWTYRDTKNWTLESYPTK